MRFAQSLDSPLFFRYVTKAHTFLFQNQRCGPLLQKRRQATDNQSTKSNPVLAAIKLLHTVIWALLAGSIVALPVAGVLRRFRWAAIITVVILLECGVLAANGGRCPLTDLAAKYTADRRPNFDIYLPNWLAEHNKVIFGTLFVAGEGVVIACWLMGRSADQRGSLG